MDTIIQPDQAPATDQVAPSSDPAPVAVATAEPKKKRNTVTVQKLQWEMARAVKLRELLGADGEADPKLLLDTIEGETDLAEMCCLLLEETVDDEIMTTGLSAKIAELQTRKSRIEQSIETRRGIILMAMDRAGIDTIKSPLGTMSVGTVKPKLEIKDEAAIPAEYWKPADPTLDRKALKAALDAGTKVEGAGLSNGGINLTIRSK